MQITRFRRRDGSIGVGSLRAGDLQELPLSSIAALLRLPREEARALVEAGGPPVDDAVLLAPVDGLTEVWASGVTYERSRAARVEESTQKDVYDRVYDAKRPELFFKSVAWRVVTDGDLVGIRSDSDQDVPEPEVAIVLNSDGEILGYLVCNDMSSRSLEGQNPLYLPQAKIYAGSCALSTGIRPVWEVDGANLDIALSIVREGVAVFEGTTSTQRMHRTFDELAAALFAEDNFPDGAILTTGTGIVPDLDFRLAVGDRIDISISEVVTLSNVVASGKSHFDGLNPRAANGI